MSSIPKAIEVELKPLEKLKEESTNDLSANGIPILLICTTNYQRFRKGYVYNARYYDYVQYITVDMLGYDNKCTNIVIDGEELPKISKFFSYYRRSWDPEENYIYEDKKHCAPGNGSLVFDVKWGFNERVVEGHILTLETEGLQNYNFPEFIMEYKVPEYLDTNCENSTYFKENVEDLVYIMELLVYTAYLNYKRRRNKKEKNTIEDMYDFLDGKWAICRQKYTSNDMIYYPAYSLLVKFELMRLDSSENSKILIRAHLANEVPGIKGKHPWIAQYKFKIGFDRCGMIEGMIGKPVNPSYMEKLKERFEPEFLHKV